MKLVLPRVKLRLLHGLAKLDKEHLRGGLLQINRLHSLPQMVVDLIKMDDNSY